MRSTGCSIAGACRSHSCSTSSACRGSPRRQLEAAMADDRRERSWRTAVLLVVALGVSVSACKRERRDFREAPPSTTTHDVVVSELRPGGGSPATPVHTPYESNAVAISEGKRLFDAYNCVGCHAHGGGGIGPALRDDQWAYGSEADQIYHTILEGR